jgi:hypothetical protein
MCLAYVCSGCGETVDAYLWHEHVVAEHPDDPRFEQYRREHAWMTDPANKPLVDMVSRSVEMAFLHGVSSGATAGYTPENAQIPTSEPTFR